jgi:hypothetical protein
MVRLVALARDRPPQRVGLALGPVVRNGRRQGGGSEVRIIYCRTIAADRILILPLPKLPGRIRAAEGAGSKTPVG